MANTNRFLAGFPPFSGATPDETWTNLKNWQRVLRRPHYDRPEDLIFNLSDDGWSAITWCAGDVLKSQVALCRVLEKLTNVRLCFVPHPGDSLIAHKDRRMSSLDQVKQHPFFRGVDWDHLRERKAPFIPALDSEVDAGYFDDVRLSLSHITISPTG